MDKQNQIQSIKFKKKKKKVETQSQLTTKRKLIRQSRDFVG